MLILLIESGSMCEDQGSSEQSGLLQLSLAAEHDPVWNNMAPYLEKKLIVQRSRGRSMLLSPSLLPETKKI